MNSIITKIFYGDLRCEKKMMKNESVKESIEKFSVAYELLNDALNEKQKKLLSELYDERCSMDTEVGLYHFKEGFTAGIYLGMELCACERE